MAYSRFTGNEWKPSARGKLFLSPKLTESLYSGLRFLFLKHLYPLFEIVNIFRQTHVYSTLIVIEPFHPVKLFRQAFRLYRKALGLLPEPDKLIRRGDFYSWIFQPVRQRGEKVFHGGFTASHSGSGKP